MKNNGRTMVLVAMFLLKLLMTEASLTCQQQQSDRKTFIVNGNQGCVGSRWKLNGTVAAHDDGATPLVQSHTSNNITFKSNQSNVSYSCEMANGSHLNIKCDQDVSSEKQDSNEDDHSKENGSIGTTIAIVIGGIVIGGIVICAIIRFRQHRARIPQLMTFQQRRHR